jgi:GH25 family lysozyme M1 (1,4-beta-N-acetylmuramidase)
MNNPILGIDTWEGQLNIDEAVLKANGVSFMFIRLNSVAGGLHKDADFDAQWAQAAGFHRAPYFVYNPFVSGSANFLWLQSNMPTDAKAVGIDIELYVSGYSSVTYAAEVQKFLSLLTWNYVIYTGEWFLLYLSTWSKTAGYWWAQYPNGFYPAETLSLSWDDLRAKLTKYTGPGNASKVPGPLKFWQFSGDRLILPGSTKPIDVNVFLGTESELSSFMGGAQTPAIEHTQPYPGVDEYIEIVNGQRCHITLIDKGVIKELRVTHFNGALGFVSHSSADIAFNAEDYDKNLPAPVHPYSLAYVDGTQYSPQHDFRKWFNWRKDKTTQYDFKNISNPWMVTSFVRPLIEQGLVNPSFADASKIENVEIHARSGFGETNNGRLIRIDAEGHVIPETGIADKGVTLPQFAALFQKYGAVNAGEHGGGGDVGKKIKGQMVVTPSDPQERAVVQVIEIYLQGANMSTRYTATAIGDNTKLRPNHNTVTDFNPAKVFPHGTVFNGVEPLWIADASNKDTSQFVGDQWMQLATGEWAPIVHRGLPVCKLIDNGVTPPPVLSDGMTITVTTDGVKKTYTVNGPVNVT